MVDDVTRARWHRDIAANNYEPKVALQLTLEAIENGEIDAAHAIIIVADLDDKEPNVKWLQAGRANRYEVLGIMACALNELSGKG